MMMEGMVAITYLLVLVLLADVDPPEETDS